MSGVDDARWVIGFGVVIIVGSLLFPVWSLNTYAAGAAVDSPSIADHDQASTEPTAINQFSELTSREQTVVENAVDRKGKVTMFGRWNSHQNPDSSLPFSGEWLGDYTLGTYVAYEGNTYKITYSSGGMPFHFPFVVGGGSIVGFVVIWFGVVRRRSVTRGRRCSISTFLVVVGIGIGLLAVVALGWIGNIEGYFWPVQ